jgi:phosphoadenosine phosphosulfate reductase
MSETAITRHARQLPGYEARLAQAVALLHRAAQAHPGRIVQSTGLGAEGMVITDLIVRHCLPIPVATLDTGSLHAQTRALMDRLEAHYGLTLERYAPLDTAVVHFVRQHGPRAMYESVALRQACCALRKLEPLARMLAGRTAWIAGLRREQSDSRSEVLAEGRDDDGRAKFAPLADWHWGDVWRYIDEHGVPYNPLHDTHHPSIGCEPCTRPVAMGEDLRAGRWWWEHGAAKECGLHGSAAAATPLPARPEVSA